ncbi:4'-phosphopantetheinyl transferase [Gammaproteobacteria bacterium]
MTREISRLAPPAPGEVHLWQGCLMDLERYAAWNVLSAVENQRLQGMSHAMTARRFRLTRIALRMLLGRYLGIPPAAVEIALQYRGKPFLPASPLQFNISHAGDRLWIALAWNRAVGVDLEQERPLEVLALARRFFHASEADYLGTLDESSRRTAFFRFWAVKEAYLKATGEGLSGLERAVLSDSALNRDWTVTQVPTPSGWAGAVVVAGAAQILSLEMDAEQLVPVTAD